MKVDIENFERETFISFKLKDFTSLDDVISIGCAMAGRYCFEANSLLSTEFKQFIENLQPRKTYAIIVGIDDYDKPIVNWGVVKKSRDYT